MASTEIEVIGGLKAEIKSEKDDNENESNIVEISADDIQDEIKKEPEQNEVVDDRGNEENVGKTESNIVEISADDIQDEIKKEPEQNEVVDNQGNDIQNIQDEEFIEENRETEVNEKGRKEDTNDSHPKTISVQEELILNYVDENSVNKKNKKKSINNNNKDENKLKEKPKKTTKFKNINTDDVKIEQREFSLDKDNTYKCNHCQALTTSKKKILKHIRHYHRDAAIFQNREEQLKELVQSVKTRYVAWYEYSLDSENQFRCNHCQELTQGQNKMESHIMKKHRNIEQKKCYQCPHCPYKSSFDLSTHILSQHTDEKDIQYFRCDKCDYKSKVKSGLNRHILTQHLNRVFSCHHCSKIFKKQESLQYHLRTSHSSSEKDKIEKRKCIHCPYECKTRESLKHHIETRHTNAEDLTTLQCPDCSYKTKYRMQMQSHKSNNHKSVLQCHICSYQCTNKTTMDLHLIGHKEKKNEKDLKYCCDQCDYKTYRGYSLQIHKLNHLKPNEIQYFYCYHCKFKAKRKDNLKTHVLRHFKQNEVSMACYICDFTTEKRHLLVRHLDNHSKEINKMKKTEPKVMISNQEELVVDSHKNEESEMETEDLPKVNKQKNIRKRQIKPDRTRSSARTRGNSKK